MDKESDNSAYTKIECIADTQKHISKVGVNISNIIEELKDRAQTHDESKLKEPELSIFTEYTPLLDKLEYNSQEYKEALKGMSVALDHHYANNRHHVEYHEEGIKGMNLVDIVEMFCDWKASVERTKDGDMHKSIPINKERYKFSDDLEKIFMNTVNLFDAIEAYEEEKE